MALLTSGAMSIGGSTTGRSINLELGRTATTQTDLTESAARTLAGVASGQIAISKFYGKGSGGGGTGPTTLGELYCGGYYTGTINAGVGTYYVLAAPNASGCVGFCAWSTSITLTNATSCVNGYANTRPTLQSATYPAGNWTATRSISGFSDWYLPARTELINMITNRASMPAGQAYGGSTYWSSSEFVGNNYYAWAVISDARAYTYTKLDPYLFSVRAVRRVPV